VWACCLMPNHVHLIAVPETGLDRPGRSGKRTCAAGAAQASVRAGTDICGRGGLSRVRWMSTTCVLGCGTSSPTRCEPDLPGVPGSTAGPVLQPTCAGRTTGWCRSGRCWSRWRAAQSILARSCPSPSPRRCGCTTGPGGAGQRGIQEGAGAADRPDTTAAEARTQGAEGTREPAEGDIIFCHVPGTTLPVSGVKCVLEKALLMAVSSFPGIQYWRLPGCASLSARPVSRTH
jgi:hypothetical protein